MSASPPSNGDVRSGESSLYDLVLRLYNVGAVKFGSYTLKSGVESPVYFYLRVIVSYPKLLVRNVVR